LTPLAAASWQRIVQQVADANGWIPQATDAYRPLEGYYGQVQTFLRRYQLTYVEYLPGRVDRRVWNGTPYWRRPGTSAAAVPGTSNHGWATAVDVTGLGHFGSAKFNQFAAVATRNGWSIAEGRAVDEPWHWTKNSASFASNPGQVVTGNIPSAPAPVDIDPIYPDEEDDMSTWFPGYIVTYPGTSAQFAVSADLTTKRHIHGAEEIALLRATGWIENKLSADTIDRAAWSPCHDAFTGVKL
jgi:hypothetical protein